VARIKIIGSGAWGTTMAKVLTAGGHQVVLWAHEPEIVEDINQRHTNNKYLDGIKLDPQITASDSFSDLADFDIVFLMVASDYYQDTVRKINKFLRSGQIVVSATKGLTSEGQPLSAVLESCLSEKNPYVIFSGTKYCR